MRTEFVAVLALATLVVASAEAAGPPRPSQPPGRPAPAPTVPHQKEGGRPAPQAAPPAAASSKEETPDTTAVTAQPMIESIRTSSKLFGAHVAKPSGSDKDSLIEQFFKKNLLENKELFGAVIEGVAAILEQDLPVQGKAEQSAAFASRAGKLLKHLASYKNDKDLPAELLDFCALYLRLRTLAHAATAPSAEYAKTIGVLEKDISDYVTRNSKQAWGQVLLALHKDLASRNGWKGALDKSPEEYLGAASVLAPKDLSIHFTIGNLYRDFLDRKELSNFLKLVATEFEKCLLLQRKNKELFAEVTAVYVEVHESLQKKDQQEPFWFEELVYRRIIALDPSNASAHNNLSFLYSQYGVNLKDALREAQIASQLKANDPLLLDTLGWAYYKNGQMDKATETLKQAVGMNKEVADTHFHLATVYYDLADVENASREFRETLRLEPDNAFARNNLAYLFSEKDVHLDEALQLVDEALEKQPDNAAFLDTKGWVYFKLKKFDQAIELLKKAVELSPETSELHLHLGKVYLATRDFDHAVKSFESALSYDPENTKIARDLSYIFAMNGLRDSLDRYAKISGVTGTKDNYKVFYDAMAAAATSAGDYENAARTLAEYASFTPHQPSVAELTATTGGKPIHEQLEALGRVIPADTDLLLSIERPGLAKLATYFAKAIAERYALAIPQMTGYDAIPGRLVLALKYLETKQASDFMVVLELPETVFDVYFQKLEGMKSEGQEVTLPIGNITVPFNLTASPYKKVTIRSVTLPQGIAHFVMLKPYAVFAMDRAVLTSVVDRMETRDMGLNVVDGYKRFEMNQKRPSDLILFLPFSKKGAAEKLPQPYQQTFKEVSAFGAAYTVASTDELTEDSIFIPTKPEVAPDVRKGLETLLGTVQKDIADRLSREIRLEAKFAIQEELVVGQARVFGFGKLVSEVLANWYKTYLPNLDLTPKALPSTHPPEDEQPGPED